MKKIRGCKECLAFVKRAYPSTYSHLFIGKNKIYANGGSEIYE